MTSLQPQPQPADAAWAAASPRPRASDLRADYAVPFHSRLIWLTIAAIAALDAIGIVGAGFDFVLESLQGPALALVALTGGAAFFRYRRRNLPAIALLEGVAQILASFAVFAVLSYLALSTNLPLAEEHVIALDRAMGFDWPRYVGWVQAHPALDQLLSLVYRSMLMQIIVGAVLLGAVRRERLEELPALIIISLLLTIAISAFVPATDTYAHFAPTHPELTVEISFKDFIPLRDGSLRRLDLRTLDGLICFPSFHTILALFFIYAMRGIRGAFPVSLVLNAMVIASTLSAGGHYLVDVIGGGAVAAVSIALYRAIVLRLPSNHAVLDRREVIQPHEAWSCASTSLQS